MYVYSGVCREGCCGEVTPLKDHWDKLLYVGDIVVIYKENSSPDGLTVVVSDRYTSFTDGTHIIKPKDEVTYFIMGIKDCCLKPDLEGWIVLKVKDHSDVVNGEHWKDFGFNYRED